MGLKDFYFKIEDKYYGFLDWLDKKGLNLYPIVDGLESKGIPSFPIFLLVIILILIGLFFLAGMLLVPAQANVTILATDAEDSTPLEGAQIIVSAAGEEKTYFTEANGEKQISLLLGQATITVGKEGYEALPKSISIEANLPKQVFALQKAAQLLSRTIQIMNDKTSQLLLQEVTLDLSCSNSEANYSETKTTSNGKLEIRVPENCGRLIARPVSGFTSTQNSLDITDSSVQLFLDPVPTEKGTINAIIKNSAGATITGATVRLVRGTGIEERVDYSTSSGSVSFTDVPTGTYYLVVHAPNYADYDGKNETKDLAANQTVTFAVSLSDAATGKIKALVKDVSSKSPVKNAIIRLKKSGTVLDTKYTDETGYCEFDAASGTSYDLEIDHPNYLLAAVNNVTAKDSANEIFLEASTPSNSNTFYVTIVDPRENPVEGAKLALKKDGKLFGAGKTTGADGKAEFQNLPIAAYTVFAEKKGFTAKESEPVTLVARQKNELKIMLDIGFGKIKAIAKDSDGSPLQNAAIKAINILDAKTESEGTTDSEGIYEFELRADKTVYLKAEAEDYLPYYTAFIVPDPDSEIEKEIFMLKDSAKLEVEFKLSAGTETVLGSVSEGQQYTARLLLKIPKKTSYGQAGIHFRAGAFEAEKTRSMQQDNVYIKEVRASTRDIVKGTTYTPYLGYGTDSANLTAGDAKWVTVVWRNASAGVYEMEADIQVKDTASLGDIVETWYRAWGKSTGYVRFPVDKELGTAESTANRQALYANANTARFTVGPSNLCGVFFCKSYTIEDLSTGIKTSVVDRYPAKMGNNYRLAFTISNNSEQLFSASALKINNETQGVKFLDYAITDAFGVETNGTINDFNLEKETGDMQKNSVVFGTIDFSTEKDSANPIDILIASEGISAFSDSITIDIEAAKEMQITLLPKTIVPLIDNELLIKVSDLDAGVSEAVVNIYLNDSFIASGKTNSNGEMSYKLQAPNTGSALKITASKPGYKKAEISVNVNNEIILVTPPEIIETLNPTEFEKEIGIRISNTTQIPLKLSSLSADNVTPDDLIEFSWPDEIINSEIPVNGDINFFVKARLTEKGLLLENTATPKGSLAIEVKNDALGRTFAKNLPLEIRIALNGAVDDAKCLTTEPGEWEILTGSETKTMEIKLLNSCKVAGDSISLKNLQAKIDFKDSEEIGKFRIIDSSNQELAKEEIGKSFSTLLPILDADSETTMLLEFTPDAGTAEAAPVITFQATNPAEKKIEKLEAKLETTISINRLEECIKITPENLALYPAAFNTGYNQYQNFGYNPTAYNGFGTDSYNGYTTPTVQGTTSGYLAEQKLPKISLAGAVLQEGYIESSTLPQNSYPYSQADIAWQSRYFDNASAGNWNYALGIDQIKIENSCTTAVDIALETEPNLTAEKDKLTLSPEETESIKIQAGYQIGIFKISVKAKINESKDKAIKIKDIEAEVIRPEEISDDCIDMQPKRISLNSFYGEPVPGRIYNYCYHLGVNLEKTDRVIEFACRVPGQSQLFSGIATNSAPKTLLLETLPYVTGNPYNPYTGVYTGGTTVYPYTSDPANPYYTGQYPTTYPYTQSGYLASGATPQVYSPYYSTNSYAGTPFTSTGYSTNELYMPQGTTAPYGQGYYNQTIPSTAYNYGSGYYYPGISPYYSGSSSGYIGGGMPYGTNGYGSYPYGSNGWNYGYSGGYEGTCPLIDSIYIMGERKNQNGNGVTQMLEFEVTPNMQYRQQLCPYGSQLPYQNLMGLRMASMGSYYRSNVNSTAQVNYTTPAGAQTAFFRVEFEDLWGGAGEGIDACLLNALSMTPSYVPRTGAAAAAPVAAVQRIPQIGNPQAATEACINKNALDETAIWKAGMPALKGFVPQGGLYWSDNGKHLFARTYPNGVLLMNIAACGATDKIELRETASKKINGLALSFEVVDDGHNIKMTTDRSDLNTKCAKAETTLKIALKRPAVYSGAKEFEINVKVWALHSSVTEAELQNSAFFDTCEKTPAGGTEPSTGTAAFEDCSKIGGKTGTEALKEYGLDRLPWNWNWADITEKTCDETEADTYGINSGEMFCDAAQFSIEVNKKGKKIADYIEEIKSLDSAVKRDGATSNGLKDILGSDTAVENSKNTFELFRWALKQNEIKDYAVENEIQNASEFKEVLFYNNSENGFLSLKFDDDKEGIIKEALGNDYSALKTSLTKLKAELSKSAPDALKINSALKEIKGSFVEINNTSAELKHQLYLVLEINYDNFSKGEQEILESFGMRKLFGLNSDIKKGYMTIADYYELQNRIANSTECFKDDSSTQKALNLGEAKNCKIKLLLKRPSADENIVSIAFMDRLYTNSSFLLVPVHTKELELETTPKLVNYLMENGKMIAAIDGYSTLLDFYKENINFNSYLIRDKYSEKFISDFSGKYPETKTEGIEVFGETKKITFQQGSQFGTSQFLDASGKYNITIEYNWETDSFPWSINFEKKAGLQDLQTELGAAKLANNVFLSMPIDGKMALLDGRDYGILFSNANDSLKIAKIDGTAINATKAEGGTIQANKLSEYSNTKGGEILKITGNEWTFSPSRPATISLEIHPLGKTASVLYGLFKQGSNNTMIDSLPVFKWVGKDNIIPETKIPAAKGKAMCSYIDNDYIGLDNITMQSSQTYKTVAFLPAGEQYLIIGFCASQSATITTDSGKIQMSLQSTAPTALDLKPATDTELTESTVQFYLEKIGESEVCVISANTGEISLKWNTAEIAKPK